MSGKLTTETEATETGDGPATDPELEATTEEEGPETGVDLPDVAAKLDFWKRQARENEKELKRLKKAEDDRRREEMTETERLRADLAERDLKIDGILRKSIAAENGLPAEFADRLRGTTEEELAADAKRFAELVKPKVPTPTDVGIGTAGGATGDDSDPVALSRRFMGLKG